MTGDGRDVTGTWSRAATGRRGGLRGESSELASVEAAVPEYCVQDRVSEYDAEGDLSDGEGRTVGWRERHNRVLDNDRDR